MNNLSQQATDLIHEAFENLEQEESIVMPSRGRINIQYVRFANR